jgi:nucleotide-binding universal stress UspA family protein
MTAPSTLEQPGTEPTMVPIERILVAYDGTQPAKRALGLAARLARAMNSTIGIVSVVPSHGGRIAGDPWDDEPTHRQELAEAEAMAQKLGVKAEVILRTGDVSHTIEREIEQGGFDTIVLGSRGLGLADRVLLGSVSQHVLTHTKATVIVTR